MEHKPKPGWKPWKPPPEKRDRSEQQPKSRRLPTKNQIIRVTKVPAALLITVMVISIIWLLWRDIIRVDGNSDYVRRGVLTVVGVLILIGVGYRFEWTGFGGREREKAEAGEIQRRKTLWDWLTLLLVPLMIAGIAPWFTWWQNNSQRALEAQQRAQEAENQAQSAALQAYLGQMSQLISEENLRLSEQGDTVYTLAQARTTTTITQLDGQQNQIVTRFLHDSGLLREPPALLANVGLENAELPKAVLNDANLAGTQLDRANLAEAELVSADLAGTNLEDAELPRAALTGANLAGTQLDRANLAEAELVSADFSDMEKVGESTQVITADLTKADLSKAALKGANLSEGHLKQATLTDATLQSADLSSADLQGADLSYAALQGAKLSPVTVPGLPGLKIPTNLTNANLSHAVLQSADLTDADLTDADLTDADLTDADLTDADLTDADLTDADLSEARGITNDELDQQARSLRGATMPNGQKYEDWLKDREERKEDGE